METNPSDHLKTRLRLPATEEGGCFTCITPLRVLERHTWTLGENFSPQRLYSWKTPLQYLTKLLTPFLLSTSPRHVGLVDWNGDGNLEA